MAFLQRFALGISLFVALTVTTPVFAQVLTVANNRDGIVRRENRDNLNVDQINFNDCAADETIIFNVNQSGGSSVGFNLELWVGTDCSNVDNRNVTSSRCRFVGNYGEFSENVNKANVRVQDLLGAALGISSSEGEGTGGTGGTGGTAGSGGTAGMETGGTAGTEMAGGADGGGTSGAGGSTAGTGGTDATAGSGGTSGTNFDNAVCDGNTSFRKVTTATLHFILVDGSDNSPEGYTPAAVPIQYDLIGPLPPEGVTAGVGENVLILKWTLPNDTTDIDHFEAFCDPPPGTIPETPEGGPPDDGCTPSSVLLEDEKPPRANYCGQSRGVTGSMQTSPLENGVYYNIAVVGVDDFKNVGELSGTTCNAPQLVTDFFEAYQRAGGKGGGGFCAIHAAPSGSLAALVALGGLAWIARRRGTRGRRLDS